VCCSIPPSDRPRKGEKELRVLLGTISIAVRNEGVDPRVRTYLAPKPSRDLGITWGSTLPSVHLLVMYNLLQILE
jgi:hypothetical protein